MYGYSDYSEGPGTAWRVKNKQLTIKAHPITVNNLFSDSHYHLYLKCAYAKAFINGNRTIPFWANLYDKMQLSRIGMTRRDKFNELLLSVTRRGFCSEYPIPIDENFQILDGSHRVAAAYACNVSPIVEVYKNPSHDYRRSWFESVGFTHKELKQIDIIKNKIKKRLGFKNKLRVGVIWGCAFEFWEEIFKEINNGKLATAFWKEIC